MNKAKIVLADDDRVILATLAEGLREAGYEIFTAADGEEALEVCQRVNPDLAILDIRMPNLSGLEVAQRLSIESATPFMFFSAYSDLELVDEAVGRGGMGYLVKPVDVPNIIPAIESALHRARDLGELKTSKDQLTQALEQDRSISVATGLIMERYKLSEKQAFERMRRYARSNGQKLKGVAQAFVNSAETLNKLD